jgi:hypothetical protein
MRIASDPEEMYVDFIFYHPTFLRKHLRNLLMNMLAKQELPGYFMEKLAGKQRIIRILKEKSYRSLYKSRV